MSVLPVSAAQKQAGAEVEFFSPLRLMENLESAASALPPPVRRLVFFYCYETEPRELFGRVEFDRHLELSVTYFIPYDKVERLFRELIVMGDTYGCRDLVNRYIQEIAQRRYILTEKPTPEVRYYASEFLRCRQQKSHRFFWHFSIASCVSRDISNLTVPNRRSLPLGTRCDTRYLQRDPLMVEEARAQVPQVMDLLNLRRLLLQDAHVRLPEASNEGAFRSAFPAPFGEMEDAFERENTFGADAVERYADLNSRSVPRDIQHRHEVESERARVATETDQAARRSTMRELKIGLSALVGFVALTHLLGRKST